MRIRPKAKVLLGTIVGAIVIALIATFLWQRFYYTFHTGPNRFETNPGNQSVVSTMNPTTTPNSSRDWFANMRWYSIEDAAKLRNEVNVVNFALLKNGGVYYSVEYGVPFSPMWTKAMNVYQITSASVHGTGVNFTVLGGDSYNLNVLQAFVINPEPGSTVLPTFWMFDQQGQLWKVTPSQPTSVLTSINQVQAQLPLTVAANPDLSLTNGR